jgi:hypothetical protein
MKKYLHPKYLPILVPLASILGVLLRLWTMGGGPDRDGLYAPQPFAWVLLWMVSFCILAGIYLLSKGLKNPGKYADNFPASPVAAVGCLAAALGVIFSSISTMVSAEDLLSTITGILGLLSAVALGYTGYARLKGVRPSFLLHTVICLYLALRVFDCCKHWSNVTQTGVFLFQFLASVCIMLATYQRCCFDVDLGKRSSHLFWSLSGVYFCALALPIGEDAVFYGAFLLWLMTNLCSVRPIKAPKAEPTADATGAEAAPAGAASTIEQEPTIDEILSRLDQE